MAMRHVEAVSFDDLEERISVYRGRLECGGYYTPYHPRVRGERTARYRPPIKYKDLKPECGEIDPCNPFFGRKVVFTGKLLSLGREEAAQLVVNNGGQCTDSVSKKTHIVVVGELDPRVFAEGKDRTSKLEKAETLASAGHDIEIIGEEHFLRMIEE